MDKLCRICLKDEGNVPIFKTSVDKEDIQAKLSACLNEEIKDIPGYPRNICTICRNHLDAVWKFIEEIRKSHRILENTIPIKKEQVKSTDKRKERLEDDIAKEGVKEVQIKTEKNSGPIYEFSIEIENNYTDTEQSSCDVVKSVKLESSNIPSITNTETEIIKSGTAVTTKPTPVLKRKRESFIQKTITLKRKKVTNSKAAPKRTRKVVKETAGNTEDKTKSQRLCETCGEAFDNTSKLQYHRQKHEDSKCNICNRVCANLYELNRHKKRVHNEQKDFVCKTCGKGFAFLNGLTSHVKVVHLKEKRPPKSFSCQICGKTYKCIKSIVLHERSVHTGERPAVCSICNTSFTHEDYLKIHMRLHTGETPFKCPICGRGYAQPCNMKSHLRTHRISELDAETLSKLRPSHLKRLKK